MAIMPFKVIHGRHFWYQSKAVRDLLYVSNSVQSFFKFMIAFTAIIHMCVSANQLFVCFRPAMRYRKTRTPTDREGI